MFIESALGGSDHAGRSKHVVFGGMGVSDYGDGAFKVSEAARRKVIYDSPSIR